MYILGYNHGQSRLVYNFIVLEFNLEPRYQFTVRKAKHLENAVLHHLATLTAKHDSREGISYIKYIHIPSQCVSLT